jgi:hypothetical protein
LFTDNISSTTEFLTTLQSAARNFGRVLFFAAICGVAPRRSERPDCLAGLHSAAGSGERTSKLHFELHFEAYLFTRTCLGSAQSAAGVESVSLSFLHLHLRMSVFQNFFSKKNTTSIASDLEI